MYINNPGLYYAQNFDVSIIPDLVNFIWQDLELLFPKKEFENLEFENIKEVQNFIFSTLKIYKKKQILPILIMDQINVLDEYSTKNKTIFFEALMENFKISIVSAMNSNKTITRLKKYGNEIQIRSKEFFEDES